MGEKKKPSVFRGFLNVIFNFFWAIFGGISMALSCIVEGVFSCIAIIPIFFGIPGVYFRMVGMAFAPAGKRVELHFGKAPVRNVFYLIFGGVVSSIWNYLLGALMCVTIIGIPLGLQQFKFAKYFLAPFGARVVKNGEDLIEDKGDAKKAPAIEAPAKKEEGKAPAKVSAQAVSEALAKKKTNDGGNDYNN